MNSTNIPTDDSPPLSPVIPTLLTTGRRRNGKVARLPKATRDRINQMLLDGLPYSEIIHTVAADGKDLNEDNLSNWKAGGYQDWLREQQRVEIIRAKYEFALDLVCDKDAGKVHQATLQI